MFPELIISGATLIIAPGPIIGQWSTEIKKHAIGRSVYIYSGRANDDYIEAEELAKYDVVLTHYEVCLIDCLFLLSLHINRKNCRLLELKLIILILLLTDRVEKVCKRLFKL
jgi:SNF2 family DNA or RNA helicase